MQSLSELSCHDRLKAFNAFLRLTDNPATFTAIYDLDEVLRETDLSMISIDHIKAQPGMATIMAERYLGPVPNLAELLTLPVDSLGYQFAYHLTMNNFDPQFYRPREVKDEISYISLRRSQTHDIFHVVTGFDTDASGELGLQAFQLAQMKSPIAITILTAGIVRTLADSSMLKEHMRQMILGWEMGLKAKPLLAQKWEDHWEKPLAQWQAELGIKPVAFADNLFWAVAA
jgi:ubiquinone biosynthesis protein Coq4